MKETYCFYIEKLNPEPDQLLFFDLSIDKNAIQIQEYRPSDFSRQAIDVKSYK
jgi:hypothetical protein